MAQERLLDMRNVPSRLAGQEAKLASLRQRSWAARNELIYSVAGSSSFKLERYQHDVTFSL